MADPNQAVEVKPLSKPLSGYRQWDKPKLFPREIQRCIGAISVSSGHVESVVLT